MSAENDPRACSTTHGADPAPHDGQTPHDTGNRSQYQEPCMGGAIHLPCDSDVCMCRCHHRLGEGPTPTEVHREHARQLVPRRPFGGPTKEHLRETIAVALATQQATERAAFAAELDRLADNYLRSPNTETNWRAVADAFYAAAERINPEVRR